MAGKAMQTTQDLTLDDFDFDLPPHLIAQHPLPERTASRLLRVASDGLDDLTFADIERLLKLLPDDAFDGVVFLGEEDSKQILPRATGRAMPLAESGIPLQRRFTFFDQVPCLVCCIQPCQI